MVHHLPGGKLLLGRVIEFRLLRERALGGKRRRVPAPLLRNWRDYGFGLEFRCVAPALTPLGFSPLLFGVTGRLLRHQIGSTCLDRGVKGGAVGSEVRGVFSGRLGRTIHTLGDTAAVGT